jgi:predicted amidohydrolase YtcJ
VTTTLFGGGRIHTLAAPADWVLVDAGSIAATGEGSDRPAADRTVDLAGAALVPAFCDGHVHLPATGLYARGLDFRGEHSAAAILGAFAGRANAAGLLFGGNFEDPLDRPLVRTDLDEVVGDQPALLARADMHSCIVSTALLDRLSIADLEGADRDDGGAPTGYLREEAAAEAWRWFEANLPRQQQIDAIRTAVDLAYSKGVARVHEMFVLEWRSWSSLELLEEAVAGVLLDVNPYVATTEVARIKEMGLARIGGDWFLDGSFGSHTAWMSAPYRVAPPTGTPATGIAYRDFDEVVAFFSEALAAGLQAGVHAIGDAAIEQAIAAWEKVAQDVGVTEVRRLGHRIEHFECATDEHIRRAARLGLRVSIQPAFDRLWGGEGALYADRLGAERALGMNRFRSMMDGGLVLGAGSDSTVTPLDPLLQMASLRDHHVESERMSAAAALRLHTLGSHALADGEGIRGTIQPGAQADLALLDRDPLAVSADELVQTEVEATWIRGEQAWPPHAASAL